MIRINIEWTLRTFENTAAQRYHSEHCEVNEAISVVNAVHSLSRCGLITHPFSKKPSYNNTGFDFKFQNLGTFEKHGVTKVSRRALRGCFLIIYICCDRRVFAVPLWFVVVTLISGTREGLQKLIKMGDAELNLPGCTLWQTGSA